MRLINFFKKRWGITSSFRAIKIFMVFPATGFTTLYIHKKIDFLLGLDQTAFFWQKSLVFVLLILPVFNIVLYMYGSVIGEKLFFYKFIKKKYRLLTGIFQFLNFSIILVFRSIYFSSI